MISKNAIRGGVLIASWALLAACSGASVTPDAGGIPQSCQDIIDACHEVDPGTGPIHDCHETAHDVGTAAACDPIATSCIAMCEAIDGGSVPQDGGVHDHDGG